jgi:3-oxoacyl-(acyl-carrier-protein) synthase
MKDLHLSVRVSGMGLFTPEGIGVLGTPAPGEVPGFKPRAHIPDRKSIKLMNRAVQLGVAAAGMALDGFGRLKSIPPPRRAFFVGATPQSTHRDLQKALSLSGRDGKFSLERFAEEGVQHIHPLWLVRGLSNNILGFGSAFWNFQGVNSNYCHGEDGGWLAIVEGARAVEEGRADIALVGGADDFTHSEHLMGTPGSEGSAFFLLERDECGIRLSKSELQPWVSGFGAFGAAKWPVALGRMLLSQAGQQ